MNGSKSVRVIRLLCVGVFISSIAGLIISSIAGNNEGWVISIGMVSVVASIVLIVTSLVASHQRIPVFSDERAHRVEQIVNRLVDEGADESVIRDLVRESVQLGRGL